MSHGLKWLTNILSFGSETARHIVLNFLVSVSYFFDNEAGLPVSISSLAHSQSFEVLFQVANFKIEMYSTYFHQYGSPEGSITHSVQIYL